MSRMCTSPELLPGKGGKLLILEIDKHELLICVRAGDRILLPFYIDRKELHIVIWKGQQKIQCIENYFFKS